MIEGLLLSWGATAAWSVFGPVLENLAQDAAKSYVGKCFGSVLSPLNRKPLTKATGLAVKELLKLLEDELLDADLETRELEAMRDVVADFLEQEPVQRAIGDLFLEPGFHLDPALFAKAWQDTPDAPALPEDFSWKRISKRFSRKVEAIRENSEELRETFARLRSAKDSEALRELSGLPPGFNLDTYREALIEYYGNLDFASLDVTGPYYDNVRLWKVFVPQSVRECREYDPQLLEIPKEELQRLAEAGELDAEQLVESERLNEERRRAYVNQPSRPVLEVANDTATQRLQRLVILGDPGSGKSCLLQYLALEWAKIDDPNLRYTAPLPLLIELRAYNRWQCPSSKGFLKYLHEASTWHRLNQQTLHHLLDQSGRVVLLLDGLDEVFDPVEREQVVNDIHRFSNEYKQVRIVVTSRVVGYKPKRLRDAEFRHFMLQDLDKEQISSFLEKWHTVTFDRAEEGTAKRKRLDKAIKNSKSIGQLAGNPLLLTMMAILNRNQKLPDDRVDLYQQCSRLLLHQWDTERALGDFPGLSEEIGLREKTTILRIVAYAMQTRLSDNARANYIDGETLEKLIEEYLHNELRFDQARAVARALVDQLRRRNFILCYLGGDSYAFVHRTFLEYFCAAEIVHQFNVAKTLDEQELIDLFDEHCRDDDWREVLRLICGQIDEKFVGRIVEHLATRTDLDKWDGETPLPELSLAIWCMNEVRSGAQLEKAGVALLLNTILCFLTGKISEHSFILDLVVAAQDIGTRWPGKSFFQFTGHYPTNHTILHHLYWPDFLAAVFEQRSWIEELATCERWLVRCGAIKVLAKKWSDEETRELLTEHIVQDEDIRLRNTALRALAEHWPDKETRELLTERAVQDESEDARCITLDELAKHWPDEETRELLTERAVQDESEDARCLALEELAKHWPDKETRELLTERVVQDEDSNPRSTALEALAKHWLDEETLQLLMKLTPVEGMAASWYSDKHSLFGEVVFKKYLWIESGYLDPHQPIPAEHIQEAAKRANIPPDKIDETLRSLSEHMGWDITKGSEAGKLM